MRRIVFIAVIAILLPSPAECVYRPWPRLVCAEYFKEQVVVIAKVVRRKYVAPDNDIDGHFYTLRVERVLRGKITPAFQVWEENSNGRAGFEWVKGRSYLLFLSFGKEEHDSWTLDGCGNSAPLSKAAKALKAIDRIKAEQNGGLVTGTVVTYYSPYSPLAGISVQVRNQEHVYEVSTAKDGTFKVRVPPGTYTAKAHGQRWLFQTDDFSYEDPEKIAIQNGSCSQIQFEGTPAEQ